MIIAELPNPQIYLESIIEFDPWPFESHAIPMARDVVFVCNDGEVKRGRHGFWLRSDLRLGRLSDGRTAVISWWYEPGTPIVDNYAFMPTPSGKSTTARD